MLFVRLVYINDLIICYSYCFTIHSDNNNNNNNNKLLLLVSAVKSGYKCDIRKYHLFLLVVLLLFPYFELDILDLINLLFVISMFNLGN